MGKLKSVVDENEMTERLNTFDEDEVIEEPSTSDEDEMTFILGDKEYSISELKSDKSLYESYVSLIARLYSSIRHMVCDLKCGAPRDYTTVINNVGKNINKIIRNEKQLNSKQKINFVLKEAKIIFPNLK